MSEIERLVAEAKTANFGDFRLSKRLSHIVAAMAKAPERSFPDAIGNDSALEGAYRFLNNEKVSFERILEPHVLATLTRVSKCGVALVLHDTTDFHFGGESRREGLGRVDRRSQGFYGHFALAVAADGSRDPLGVLGVKTIFRQEALVDPKFKKGYRENPNSEFKRWPELVRDVSDRVGESAELIHVMDREGDAYQLLDTMVQGKERFVIRAVQDRILLADDPTSPQGMHEAATTAELIAFRTVPLSRRTKRATRGRSTYAPREGRTAMLKIKRTSVIIKRPRAAQHAGRVETIALNLVHIAEVNAPEGAEPVEWTLLTTEPVETQEEVLRIVDHYRTRWMIEEFFKALKSGCAYEKRQLESRATLVNALAVFIPIAWTLLALRYYSREGDETAASSILPSEQIEVLRAVSRKELSLRPTAREALLAIAALGGHIKNNGDPGWQVIGRGYQRLLDYQTGWASALRRTQNRSQRCDLS